MCTVLILINQRKCYYKFVCWLIDIAYSSDPIQLNVIRLKPPPPSQQISPRPLSALIHPTLTTQGCVHSYVCWLIFIAFSSDPIKLNVIWLKPPPPPSQQISPRPLSAIDTSNPHNTGMCTLLYL